MQIQCDCGTFKATIDHFPKATPGRLMCYCDDCQVYLMHLKRTDLLDEAGGTEIVPVYPANMKVVSGASELRCLRLSDKGPFRWSVGCCNTPILNTRPTHPWLGVFANVYNKKDPRFLEKTFGPIRSRILGKYAKGAMPPPGTPKTFDFKAMRTVLPFTLKGRFGGKSRPSPFFDPETDLPIREPVVLSANERASLQAEWVRLASFQHK